MLSSDKAGLRWYHRALLRIPTLVLHPFEVWTAILATTAGIPFLFGTAPESIRAALPDLLVRAWGVEFVVGGALVAVGLLTKHPRLERWGLMYGLGPSATAYGFAVLAFGGANAIVAAAHALAFGLACGFRLLQPVLLHAMRKDVKAATAEKAGDQ